MQIFDRNEANKILTIAAPIMISQLAQIGINVVDVVMAGNMSPQDLAAISVGASLWFPILLFLTGIMIIASALIATANGENDNTKVKNTASQAIYLGIFCGFIGLAYGLICPLFTQLLSLEPVVIEITNRYLLGLSVGAPAIGLFLALRNYSEGLGLPKSVTLITLLGLLINIPLNDALMNGKLGLPPLGGAGCGWATAIVNWIMLILLYGYIKVTPAFKAHNPLNRLYPKDIKLILTMVRLGTPIGASIFFECTLFSVVTLMVSKYGIYVLAGHEIAHNVASVVFMIPLSVAMATTVRSGYLLGKKEISRARTSGFTGVCIASLIAGVTSLLMLAFNTEIASLYSSDQKVIQTGGLLIVFAAIFQLSDATQVSAAGALRAYQDTRATMIITFVAYWLVGLPSGYLLAETSLIVEPMAAKGYWTGTSIGLSAAAVLLLIRYIKVSHHHR